MPHNLIFMALHFAISKSKAVLYFRVSITSLTHCVCCSVRELSARDVSGFQPRGLSLYVLIEFAFRLNTRKALRGRTVQFKETPVYEHPMPALPRSLGGSPPVPVCLGGFSVKFAGLIV